MGRFRPCLGVPKDKYYKAQNDKYDAEKKYSDVTLDEVVKQWFNVPVPSTFSGYGLDEEF